MSDPAPLPPPPDHAGPIAVDPPPSWWVRARWYLLALAGAIPVAMQAHVFTPETTITLHGWAMPLGHILMAISMGLAAAGIKGTNDAQPK
jgi:hypothetical protein